MIQALPTLRAGSRLKAIKAGKAAEQSAKSLATDARLSAIERLQRKVLRALRRSGLASVALAKFGTSGDRAAPLTSEEAGAVLGRSRQAIADLVYQGKLKRRYDDRAGFHPDDLRAYLNSRA